MLSRAQRHEDPNRRLLVDAVARRGSGTDDDTLFDLETVLTRLLRNEVLGLDGRSCALVVESRDGGDGDLGAGARAEPPPDSGGQGREEDHDGDDPGGARALAVRRAPQARRIVDLGMHSSRAGGGRKDLRQLGWILAVDHPGGRRRDDLR